MNYKLSLYTARVVVHSRIYLYNSFTDSLIALTSDVDELLSKHKGDLGALENVHPEFFHTLVQGRFIITESTNEWEEVFSQWDKEDLTPTKFSMIINPTLDCNMRCWYCYEQHNSSAYMSAETITAIQQLIEKKTSSKELIGLNIDFFGGEPLLHYHKSVQPILEYAYSACEQRQKQLFVSFTTNGYLLSSRILDSLEKYSRWGKIRMQITLDGNEELHNRTRTLGGTHPTYKQIATNICRCVQRGIVVLVRFNYTQENISSFYDVIDEFFQLAPMEKELLSFAFHKVWQASKNEQLEKEVELVKSAFKAEGFSVDSSEPFQGGRCYGDRDNHIVINYNGDLYKCTAREFLPASREGVLSAEGDLLWNNKYEKRMSLKQCPPICHHCMIFPICHRGCTQNKLETSARTNECLWHFTDAQKRKLLERKIEFRITE